MAEKELYFADENALKRYKIQKISFNILVYGFLSIMALFMLIPFYWMIVTSLKNDAVYEAEQISKTLNFFPTSPSLENYGVVLGKSSGFIRYFGNTIFVALCQTALTVITTVLSSFAFARLEFKGKNVIFSILLSTMMIPGELFLITNYQTVMQWKWGDTYQALILTHCISVFYIFYLRQTFQQIPNELYLAAKVDGYGDFKYLAKVMIPMAMPTIVTIIILGVMGAWGAFMWPTLVANSENMRLVSNGLMAKFSGEFASRDNVKLAASVVVTTPLFIFFLCFRKYIMRGVSRSGIKG